MMTNNAEWDKGSFYLYNNGVGLPPYTEKVLTECPVSWGYGVSDPMRRKKLEPYLEAL
jgi:hypothetical protein